MVAGSHVNICKVCSIVSHIYVRLCAVRLFLFETVHVECFG